MSLETQSLEFGEFLLNLKEKALLRNGERLPINPKTFQLLATLLENHGHLVEKERLMKTLWPDSFVEEANLAFTVSLLRKTLGDDAQNPRFIETVPRRGYRFVANVQESVSVNGAGSPPATHIEQRAIESPRLRKLLVGAAVLLIIGMTVGSLWYARSRSPDVNAPILSAAFSSEKLSTDGKVRHAIISPDGRNVIYTNAGQHDRQSVWIRDLESGSNVQIIPPSDNVYYGLALSPDGNFLYFSRSPDGPRTQSIYRVSIFGGVPSRVAEGTEGWMSLSPDGEKISFVRCPYRDDEYCSLVIADAADGKNERKLLSRPDPIRIGDNKISPDGKTIAFAVGQSGNAANEFGLAEVDIESGVEHEITPEKFFNVWHLAWLPDQRGLLLTAKRYPDNNFRIWQASIATGQIEGLTNDSVDYFSALSLNKDASVLVSTTNRADYRLNFYRSGSHAGPPLVLAEASAAGFAPNGKIVFSSAMTGNHEIWSIHPDGSEQRQLTNQPAVDLFGLVSHDNRFIFFDSNRTGEAQVWRMNADGSNQLQITRKGGGYPVLVSPDGNWLYYTSAPQRKLMRVPTEGGEEELIFDKRFNHFALSPDATRIAFSEKRDKQTVILIVSLADKKTMQVFDVPNEKTGFVQTAWSADGKSLFYVSPDDKFENYMIWEQPLDGKMPVRIADLGPDQLRETRAFAVSPDGRSFAVIQGSWKHDAVLLKGLN